MFQPVLAAIWVPRLGRGRARTTPTAVLADKAYSSRANRAELRRRGITAVIPEPLDQQAHRTRRGSAGGRPRINRLKHWRGLATRYDKHATNYRGAIVLAAILTWTPI